MGKASIADLQIDMKKPLNNETKRRFEKILEDEFQNQTTILNADIENATQSVISEHMKQVEFEKLVDEINKCKDQLKRAEEKLRVTGLQENGSIRTEGQWVEGAYCYVAEAGKLKAKIDKATVSLRQPRNVKNKIIARLHMASAMGEAVVIMNEVLGNGLIPTVDKKELLALEAPKE